MWTIARGIVVAVGGVAAVSVSLVQLRKECQDTTFVECLGDAVNWMSGESRARPGAQALLPPAKTSPLPPVTSSTGKAAPPGSPARGFTVINAGNEPVFHVFASRCEERNWGTDRLGSNEVISPGQRRMLNLQEGSGPCCYDMRVRFKSGTKRDLMGVDVCRLTHWTVNNQ
ncbi:MAG TPA: hypothetical protein VNK52_06025 [Hyphomicrobiaceae bacterium]|nr:hypothetical protein [Hyphomicrobiaceae bacterium]